MAVFIKVSTQKFPVSVAEMWDFISSPANLKLITPPYMGFDIINKDNTGKMYPGMIISYHVSPLLGIKTLWVTEITHVKESEFFVDEQRVGPYKLWHHQHILKEIPGGVLMEDIVTYQPPLGFLGRIANSLIIRNKLNEIFDFRKVRLEEKYGKFPGED
ncbi:MAG: hypothetical protein AB9842_04410 [Bacteroidales bacterium]